MSFGTKPVSGGPYVKSFAVLRNQNVTSNINNPAWTELPFGTATEEFTDDDFTLNGNGLECNFDGTVMAVASVFMVGTIQRQNVSLRFYLNGAIPTYRNRSDHGYIRFLAIHHESSVTVKQTFEVTSGDIISIYGLQDSAAGTVVMDGTSGNESSFTLLRIK